MKAPLFIPRLLLVTITFTLASSSLHADTHYVTPLGSAAPERDQPNRPWQLVEAAVNSLPNGPGLVSIAPGLYREAFLIDRPVTLTAPQGGVTIGTPPNSEIARTTFHTLTWNTHLFGDVVGPSWVDYPRAEAIGNRIAAFGNSLDLVAFNEIWDEDLFLGGDGAVGILNLAGYPRGLHGSETTVTSPANSGLAMMSRSPWSNTSQTSFDDCYGFDECASNKGYIAATVQKDNFNIRVIATHTQAGSDPLDDEGQVDLPKAARTKQIVQLLQDTQKYREANPSHVVIILGDLNVTGESKEYETLLRPYLDALGGRDAARNSPTHSIYQNPAVGHTLTSFNELALYFDDTPYNERLDYACYFPSLDGSIIVQPRFTERILARNTTPWSEDDFTSDEMSDHYPLNADFDLIRIR